MIGTGINRDERRLRLVKVSLGGGSLQDPEGMTNLKPRGSSKRHNLLFHGHSLSLIPLTSAMKLRDSKKSVHMI